MNSLQTFTTSPYTPEHFKDFIQQAFPQAQLLNSPTTPYKDGHIIHAYAPICQDIELESSHILQVFAFEVGSTHAKVTLHKELAKIAKNNASHILACFYDPSDTQEFRLSLITTGFDFEANKSTHSNLRRQSFTLGSSIPTHTAQKQLQTLIDSQAKSKQALEEAFSLEPVTKEFYGEIVKIFITLIDSIQLPLEVDCHDSATAESRNDDKRVDSNKREFSLRLLSRLLFCKFLEKKGVIDQAIFSTTLSDNYYHEVLEPLFFSTLNTPKDARNYDLLDPHIAALLKQIPYLNGGLFAPQASDFYSAQKPTAYHATLKVPNAPLAELFTLLESYHFSIDESTPDSQEVGLNPELLGLVFESLLSELFTDNRKDSTASLRKSTGSYYTPREIVRYMCRTSLYQYLVSKMDSAFGDRVGFLAKNGDCGGEPAVITALGNSLDSPCKAPFLSQKSCREQTAPTPSLRADEIGVAIHNLIFNRDPSHLPPQAHPQILSALQSLKVLDPACGSGAFPIGLMQELLELGEILGDTRSPYTRKLEILQSNIYGIDIQPMATEISRLRCFLSLILEEAPKDIKPLPNLEFKFLSANSLLPLPQDSMLEYDGYQADKQKLESIRQDNFSADLSKRESLKQDYLETAAHIARNLILHAQGESPLTQWNPYDPHSVAEFFDSEYMFGLSGFDIVIGNPPYIDYRKIDKETKEALSKNSKVYKENKEGSIFVYFIEKAADLMNQKGNSVFINPISYIIADSGSGIRNFIDTHLNLIKIIDVSNFKVFKSASAYTCINHFIHNTNENTFIEFARIDDSTQLDFMPLIKIPKVQVESISTKLDNIVDKINNINTNLSNYCDIFCGLSVAGFRKDVSNNKNEINVPFLESKDIYRYQFTSGKYLAKPQTYYSKEKLKIFQQAEIIFMARMTNFIRCCIAPIGFFGGKVNVLHNFKVNKLVILGILNSKLMSYFYAKKYFALHMQGGAFGFDTTSIKNLPIPQIDSTTEARFVKIVQEILESKKQGKDTQELESKLDKMVYELYGLNNDEIKIIENLIL